VASKALAQFGDNAAYALLAGGSFESGAPGWSLNRAEIVRGSGANGGTDSLVIQPLGTAVSPTFCVSSEYPSFRFFARQVSGISLGAALNVSLRWTDAFGLPQVTPVGLLPASGSWVLSPVLKLASALPLWQAGSTLDASVAFQPTLSGAWAIDDVLIDPYSR
jgi:hypothetical protein